MVLVPFLLSTHANAVLAGLPVEFGPAEETMRGLLWNATSIEWAFFVPGPNGARLRHGFGAWIETMRTETRRRTRIVVAQAVLPALISPQDYLRREAAAATKHEYIDGIVCEMAGASPRHLRLTKNLHGLLYRVLGNGPCENLDQDVKVWITARSRYYYPDATISCPPNFIDDENGVIDNPTVVIEALSPSTRSLDRGPKFADYRTLPSLRDYVLIDSEAKAVEVVSLEDGEWRTRTYREGTARLPSVGIEIDLEELYRRVPL